MKLFNKEDILTSLTTNKAKIGDKGYFGSNLKDIETSVEYGDVHSLVKIYDEDSILYPFEGDHTVHHFALFLPADKVKNKEPTYRPFNNIEELLDFLMPDFDADDACDQAGNKVEIDKYEKAKILLGKKITLKKKENNFVKVITINEVGFYGNDENNDIYLNFSLVCELFYYYEILINGEWVPFGVKE